MDLPLRVRRRGRLFKLIASEADGPARDAASSTSDLAFVPQTRRHLVLTPSLVCSDRILTKRCLREMKLYVPARPRHPMFVDFLAADGSHLPSLTTPPH